MPVAVAQDPIKAVTEEEAGVVDLMFNTAAVEDIITKGAILRVSSILENESIET